MLPSLLNRNPLCWSRPKVSGPPLISMLPKQANCVNSVIKPQAFHRSWQIIVQKTSRDTGSQSMETCVISGWARGFDEIWMSFIGIMVLRLIARCPLIHRYSTTLWADCIFYRYFLFVYWIGTSAPFPKLFTIELCLESACLDFRIPSCSTLWAFT